MRWLDIRLTLQIRLSIKFKKKTISVLKIPHIFSSNSSLVLPPALTHALPISLSPLSVCLSFPFPLVFWLYPAALMTKLWLGLRMARLSSAQCCSALPSPTQRRPLPLLARFWRVEWLLGPHGNSSAEASYVCPAGARCFSLGEQVGNTHKGQHSSSPARKRRCFHEN